MKGLNVLAAFLGGAAVGPSEARIYELNYRRFGNCEKMYVMQK